MNFRYSGFKFTILLFSDNVIMYGHPYLQKLTCLYTQNNLQICLNIEGQ